MLAPLLEAGRTEQVVAMLPQLADALAGSTGDKHSVHVRKASTLLAGMLTATGAGPNGRPFVQEDEPEGAPEADPEDSVPESATQAGTDAIAEPNGDASATPSARTVESLQEFLVALWADDAHRGVWQTVHGVEGSLPLLFGLEGPQALVAIAETAANDGGLWLQ